MRRDKYLSRKELDRLILRETGNLRLVQKQLGHTSPTTTANMYADVPFEDQVAALAKVFP